MSHKGQKIRSYSIDFKLKAVEYAEIDNIKAAANKFNIDRKRISGCQPKIHCHL